MADIQMPQLGETVTEGTITKWFKAVGDHVTEDEVLFEVSTDKVDSEVPSPASGYLMEILVPEGDTVDVGATLAILGDEAPGGAAAGGDGADAARQAAEGAADTPSPRTDDPAVTEREPASAGAAGAATAAPETAASEAGAPEAAATPEASAAPEAPGASGDGAPALVVSPVVRRLLAQHDIDPTTLQGSGLGGRITRADAEAAVADAPSRSGSERMAPGGRTATPAPAAAHRGATPTTRREVPLPAPLPATGEREVAVPFNNIRKRTGEHMVRSKATSPHAVSVVEVDYESVDRVRRAHRDRWSEEEGFSLTYLPFIARAVIDALEDFPHLNATVGDGELLVHRYVNLAIAVDLDFEGLLAPVVRDAEGKRLRAIAREINDLAGRARSKQLSADDVTGGTFTISNSGSFGSHLVLPIISQPQVAILSTDGISRKPVVITSADGTEAIAIHSVGLLAMSWDHRAFDGAYAAAFLSRIREVLETRDWEAEL